MPAQRVRGLVGLMATWRSGCRGWVHRLLPRANNAVVLAALLSRVWFLDVSSHSRVLYLRVYPLRSACVWPLRKVFTSFAVSQPRLVQRIAGAESIDPHMLAERLNNNCRVGAVPTVFCIHDFVTPNEEAELLASAKSSTARWTVLSKRRLQALGKQQRPTLRSQSAYPTVSVSAFRAFPAHQSKSSLLIASCPRQAAL